MTVCDSRKASGCNHPRESRPARQKKIRFADWTMKKLERESILSHAGRTTALPSGGTRRRCIDTPLRRFDVRRGVGGKGLERLASTGEMRTGEGGFFRDLHPFTACGGDSAAFLHGRDGVVCRRAGGNLCGACVHRSCHSTMPNIYSNANQTCIGLVERARKHPRPARCRRATWDSATRGKSLAPNPSVSAPRHPLLSVIRGSWRSPPRCSGQSR